MLEFARTFARTMQQGLGFRLVLWKGDLNMRHFPGISCRDDLKMLISPRPLCKDDSNSSVFCRGHLTRKTFKRTTNATAKSSTSIARGGKTFSGKSPLNIFQCQKVHQYEPFCYFSPREMLWTVLNWTRGAPKKKQNENALQSTPVQGDNFAELSC